ncbi:MAG: signal peptidase I [Thermoprotei archaeon]
MRGFFSVLVLFLVVLLFLGKFLPVPFGVMLIASRSMEPSLNVGDFVVVFGRDFGVGDVVAWCASPLYCVVHRVMNITSGSVITKGDANPIPDLPVPVSLVKGRVVYVVRREVWLSFVGGVCFFVLFRKRRDFIRFLRYANNTPLVVLIVYLLISSFVLLLSTIMFSNVVAPIRQPVIYLSRAYFEGHGVYVTYVGEGLELQRVDSCFVSEPLYYSCDALIVNGSHAYVYIPDKILMLMNVKGSPLILSFNASLYPGGRLNGVYKVYTTFNDLIISVNDSLNIVNNNIFPVVVNVTWFWADAVGSWNRTFEEYTVTDHVSVRIPTHKYVFVDLEYVIGGVKRNVRLKVV